MKMLLLSALLILALNACMYKAEIHQAPQGNIEDFEEGIDVDFPWYSTNEVKKIKAELNVDIPAEKPPERVRKDARNREVSKLKNALLDREETAKRVDLTVKNMVKYASFTLRKKGLTVKAQEIETEYNDYYQNYAYRFAIGALQNIGDHPPMWDWLDKLEKELRAALGDWIMKVTRLEDLRTFNYGIVIVLQPGGDERTSPPTMISKLDYSQHFVPFAGVLSYWTAWGICTGATWGAGAITFICSPVGMIAERVMVLKIAPDLSDEIWERANN